MGALPQFKILEYLDSALATGVTVSNIAEVPPGYNLIVGTRFQGTTCGYAVLTYDDGSDEDHIPGTAVAVDTQTNPGLAGNAPLMSNGFVIQNKPVSSRLKISYRPECTGTSAAVLQIMVSQGASLRPEIPYTCYKANDTAIDTSSFTRGDTLLSVTPSRFANWAAVCVVAVDGTTMNLQSGTGGPLINSIPCIDQAIDTQVEGPQWYPVGIDRPPNILIDSVDSGTGGAGQVFFAFQ